MPLMHLVPGKRKSAKTSLDVLISEENTVTVENLACALKMVLNKSAINYASQQKGK